jgi:predicted PurR-regulated permease PerM
MEDRDVNSQSSTLNTILISVVVVATLCLARDVLMPIALAWILSFMLEPPVRILQNLRVPWGPHVPRWSAVVVIVLVVFGAIFALGGIMAHQVTQLAGHLSDYQVMASAKIQKLEALIPFPFQLPEPSGYSFQILSGLIRPILGTFATSGIVIVFAIFILMQRKELRNRLVRIVGSTDIPHTIESIDEAADRLSHLFLTQLAINTSFAILIGLGLWFIGIPSPILWGTLAGILRFIPYVGSILSMLFPLALAFSVDAGWSKVFWTGALFLGLEPLTGQFLEPLVVGRSTGLSPVAVVVAATFWTWVWGPVGLVLATPLTVILVVFGRRVEALKFLDVLFGDEPALSEAEFLYQRMLARDPVEPVEQASSFIAAHSPAYYCDKVARHALILAQRDAERGVLEECKRKSLRETVEALFANIISTQTVPSNTYRSNRPFANMVRTFLRLASAPHADAAVHLINELGRRRRISRTGAGITSAAKLPVPHKAQLAPIWRSGKPLVAIGVQSELDKKPLPRSWQLWQKCMEFTLG